MSALAPSKHPLVDAIDAALPQIQCGKCGYSACRPYAVAIAAGEADINRCPPGGDDGVRVLSALAGVAYKPLDPSCGAPTPPAIAVIDEQSCIGCTLCIRACPVDAIVGAARLMHTVIAQWCTGCELCIPPCPVDCIRMRETGAAKPADPSAAAARARLRYEARNQRLKRNEQARAERVVPQRVVSAESRKRETIERALKRALERQTTPSS
jgi:electron transport complex protein RnfB